MTRRILIVAALSALASGAAVAAETSVAGAREADHNDHHHEVVEPWQDPLVWRVLKSDVNTLTGVLAVTAAVFLKARRRRDREASS